jgi:type VI secretion system secreted protein VgrG
MGRIGRPRRRRRAQINALITDAAMWGEEGRHVQYKLTLRPWLHLATLASDCKIYQNKTVVQILDELLGGYDFAVDKRLIERYPVRDYQTQYNESDFDFFSRLCQEWGISYFFEHSEGKHRLVLVDNMGAYRKSESAAYHEVDYHAPGWKVDAEYISSFAAAPPPDERQVRQPRLRLHAPESRPEHRPLRPRPTGQADAEVYQWHAGRAGSHYAQPRAGSSDANDPFDAQGEGRQLALLRMQALRTHGARAQASGNLRGMVPGCTFLLRKHPRQKANTEYLVLDTRFLIEDVAQDSQIGMPPPRKAALEGGGRLHRASDGRAAAPGAHAGQAVRRMARSPPWWSALPARTSGPTNWAASRCSSRGTASAQKNQHSTCWVRVSSPWAGNQLGGSYSAHRPGGDRRLLRGRSGPADLHRARLQPGTTCRRGRCRGSRRLSAAFEAGS